ncbi:hypothetical protein AVEN_160533-1 [Araneus ventricosus]|uniref:Uncharacterized protein n=1 Tax=Araneus ventricosus TaxID=182803 RepID=A0A4Y2PEJ2_ARAVE|nr:hypothetical protein AVEN_160533-1 [Araneus ventricosus]
MCERYVCKDVRLKLGFWVVIIFTMEEASCTTYYELPVQALLEQELKQCENPHVTYETLVLRLVKRLLLQLNLPWSHVLETVRQLPCLMDEK